MRAINKIKIYKRARDGRVVFLFEGEAGEPGVVVKFPPAARVHPDLFGQVCVDGALVQMRADGEAVIWMGARKLLSAEIKKKC